MAPARSTFRLRAADRIPRRCDRGRSGRSCRRTASGCGRACANRKGKNGEGFRSVLREPQKLHCKTHGRQGYRVYQQLLRKQLSLSGEGNICPLTISTIQSCLFRRSERGTAGLHALFLFFPRQTTERPPPDHGSDGGLSLWIREAPVMPVRVPRKSCILKHRAKRAGNNNPANSDALDKNDRCAVTGGRAFDAGKR